jgi:hypothetical protein
MFVQELKNSSATPKNNVYFFKDQKAFRKLKKSQFWFDLHKSHILLPDDKNTELCIMFIKWVTEQSKKQLNGTGYKCLTQTTNNNNREKTTVLTFFSLIYYSNNTVTKLNFYLIIYTK